MTDHHVITSHLTSHISLRPNSMNVDVERTCEMGVPGIPRALCYLDNLTFCAPTDPRKHDILTLILLTWRIG